MSRSSPAIDQGALAEVIDGLRQLEPELLFEDGRARSDLDVGACTRLLASAVRLFVAAGNASALDDEEPLPSFDLAPTDAVVAAAALLRDQNLSPFDLTLWFQRVASEAKKTNSFNAAAARAKIEFAERLAEAGSILA
jgi:hypothetical protein